MPVFGAQTLVKDVITGLFFLLEDAFLDALGADAPPSRPALHHRLPPDGQRRQSQPRLIAVKFMSQPGEQFMIRREAYACIKQAFVENGIEFASRRVTVDSEAEAHAGRAAAAGIAVG